MRKVLGFGSAERGGQGLGCQVAGTAEGPGGALAECPQNLGRALVVGGVVVVDQAVPDRRVEGHSTLVARADTCFQTTGHRRTPASAASPRSRATTSAAGASLADRKPSPAHSAIPPVSPALAAAARSGLVMWWTSG